MKYKTRVTQITIVPEGEWVFSDVAINIKIDDDGGGEFIAIKQAAENAEKGEIRLLAEEWQYVNDAVNVMLKEIRENEVK